MNLEWALSLSVLLISSSMSRFPACACVLRGFTQFKTNVFDQLGASNPLFGA